MVNPSGTQVYETTENVTVNVVFRENNSSAIPQFQSSSRLWGWAKPSSCPTGNHRADFSCLDEIFSCPGKWASVNVNHWTLIRSLLTDTAMHGLIGKTICYQLMCHMFDKWKILSIAVQWLHFWWSSLVRRTGMHWQHMQTLLPRPVDDAPISKWGHSNLQQIASCTLRVPMFSFRGRPGRQRKRRKVRGAGGEPEK